MDNVKEFISINKYIILLLLFFSISALSVSFTQSIWLDEGLNIEFAGESIAQNIERSMTTDLHPPLYYIFEHIISRIFGSHIIVFRLLSLIFYILSGIILYRYITYKGILDKNKQLLFLLLFLSSPFAFFYASEARSYMFIIFISLIQFISFDKIFDSKENVKKQIIVYTVTSIIGAYTYYTIIFLMIAEFFYVLLFKRSYFKKLFLPWFLIFISYLPWIWFAILSRVSGGGPGHFLSIPWWQIPAIIFAGFGGGRAVITDMNHLHNYWPTVMVLLAYTLPLWGLFVWFKKRQDREFLIRLLFIFIIPIVICLLISYFSFSVFDPRYYTEIFPLFILLLCFSLYYLFQYNKKIAITISTILIIINFIIGGLYVFNPWYQREPWKRVVSELETRLGQKDAIVFIGYNQPPPTYWLYQKKDIEIVSSYPMDLQNTQDYERIYEHIINSISDNERVWYSQFLEWQKDPDQKIRKVLDSDFEYKETIGFFKVKFDLYERK